MSLEKKKVILVDIDEVVAKTVEAVNCCIKQTTGICINYRHWKRYRISENRILSGFKNKILSWFVSEDFLLSIEPIPKAVEGILLLSVSYKIIFASNRKSDLLDITKLWLSSHKFYFDEVFCLPDKTVLVSEFKPTFYIEDCLSNLVLARKKAEEAQTRLLLNDRPWNQNSVEMPIARCRDWDPGCKNSIINIIKEKG